MQPSRCTEEALLDIIIITNIIAFDKDKDKDKDTNTGEYKDKYKYKDRSKGLKCAQECLPDKDKGNF